MTDGPKASDWMQAASEICENAADELDTQPRTEEMTLADFAHTAAVLKRSCRRWRASRRRQGLSEKFRRGSKLSGSGPRSSWRGAGRVPFDAVSEYYDDLEETGRFDSVERRQAVHREALEEVAGVEWDGCGLESSSYAGSVAGLLVMECDVEAHGQAIAISASTFATAAHLVPPSGEVGLRLDDDVVSASVVRLDSERHIAIVESEHSLQAVDISPVLPEMVGEDAAVVIPSATWALGSVESVAEQEDWFTTTLYAEVGHDGWARRCGWITSRNAGRPGHHTRGRRFRGGRGFRHRRRRSERGRWEAHSAVRV
ncbi:MAG: hypothetical protein U5R31_17130 [Acidimicrobiia bacterium]|nr:hypothetical protein [Acidimicrobiia bacterium]